MVSLGLCNTVHAKPFFSRGTLTFVTVHFKRVKNTQLVPAVGFYVKGLFAFFVDDGSTKRSLFVGIKKGMTSC